MVGPGLDFIEGNTACQVIGQCHDGVPGQPQEDQSLRCHPVYSDEGSKTSSERIWDEPGSSMSTTEGVRNTAKDASSATTRNSVYSSKFSDDCSKNPAYDAKYRNLGGYDDLFSGLMCFAEFSYRNLGGYDGLYGHVCFAEDFRFI